MGVCDVLFGSARRSSSSLANDRAAELWGIPQSSSGVTVNESSALSLSSYFSAITLIAGDIACMPWSVFRRDGDLGRFRESSHPVHRLLHKSPNPEMSPFTFKFQTVCWLLGWGNAYAEIERSALGDPVNLWPIEPWRVETRRDASTGQVIHDVWNNDGRTTTLSASDVYHVMGFSKNGVTGISIASIARESLGLSLAAEKYGAQFFGNAAQPSGAFIHPQKLGDEAIDRVSKDIKSFREGNRHGTLILEEGMKWESFVIPNNDAQFLETRKFQAEEVARWFNIPQHKIKVLDRATFSNIEEQSREFVQDTLMPHAKRLEEQADLKLIGADEPELFTRFNFSALLRGDSKTRAEVQSIYWQHGVLSTNEIRAHEDMNPIGEDGDVRYRPLNMERLDVAQQEVPDNSSIPPTNDVLPPKQISSGFVPVFESVIANVSIRTIDAVEKKKTASKDWLLGCFVKHRDKLSIAASHGIESLTEIVCRACSLERTSEVDLRVNECAKRWAQNRADADRALASDVAKWRAALPCIVNESAVSLCDSLCAAIVGGSDDE